MQFGKLLKSSRKAQGLSQLELALKADVSQRHLSFLESGRSQPSEDIILHLGSVLDLHLRQRNVLLSAAGFRPRFREGALTEETLAPVRKAIDFMLQQHLPYPAWVVDARWDVLQQNAAAQALMEAFFPGGVPADVCPDGRLNALRITFHPAGLAPYIENIDEIATHFLHRLQRDAGHHEGAEDLYNELMGYGFTGKLTVAEDSPLLASRFVKGELQLELFSMISTLGTPLDITAQELRIESLFPANTETEAFFRRFMNER